MKHLITIKDYTKSLNLGRPSLDGKAMCSNKWTYLYIDFHSNIIRNCYNVPPRTVNETELDLYGVNFFFDHPYEIQRRQEKLDNIRHSDCSNCWNCEDRGVRSQRKPEPFYEAHRLRAGISRGTQAIPTFLELYFNNTCDLKCVYCNESSSSQWAAELKKYDEYKIYQDNALNSKLKKVFYEWFEEDGSKEILSYNILGGEPTIQNEFYEFLEYLLDILKKHPNKYGIKPELALFTNGNTPRKYMEKWLSILENLQEHISIRIDFSNESIGERSEFIRSNLNWVNFEKNINQTIKISKDKDIRIRLACTQTVLSIPTFIEYLKWAKNLESEHGIQLEFGSNSVVQPSYLSPWNLTVDFKNNIEESMDWINQNSPRWKDYSEYLSSIKEGLGKFNIEDLKFIPEFVERMKTRRGLDFLKTFPELSDWYEFCRKITV